MNKKEILEIKKILKKDNTRIDRITGCYIDGEKEKKAVFTNAFLSMPDEEMHKYSEILRKTLSGSIGKNLNTLEFSIDEEMNGSRHKLLMELVDSELKNEEALNEFYENVISTYVHVGNYLVLIAHGMYDVPTKTKDGMDLDDASEYVYPFIICSICPVNLSKPGLCFDQTSAAFVEHLQDWMLEMPETGFLFPAFTDRNKDIHSLLYYSKNADVIHGEFTGELLGCEKPIPAAEQQESFNEMVEDVFGRECSLEIVKEVHETLNRIIEENKDEPEPIVFQRNDIKNIFADLGADDEQLSKIDEKYDTNPDDGKEEVLMADNLACKRKFEVKTPDITVNVSSDRTDLVETMIIEGRECLIIPLTDEITVNGIRIHPKMEEI